MTSPILKLTDGTTEISLLSSEGTMGWFLDDWIPEVSDYKGGGIRRDNSRADGTGLSGKQWSNVDERFEVILKGTDQDDAIQELQDIRRLLEKASDYWTAPWQNEPVWIEASGSCETETRYGLVVRGRIPQDDNPHAQPFFNEPAILGETGAGLALLIERVPWWLSEKPGMEVCVQASAEQEGWNYRGWTTNTTRPNGLGYEILELASGRLLLSDTTNQVWRTDDGGATAWVAAAVPPAMSVYAMVEDVSGGFVYAAGQVGIWRSGDGGVNWVQRNAVQNASTNDTLTISTSGRLVLSQLLAGIYTSDDGGATWTLRKSGTDVRATLGVSDGSILANVDGVLYRSTDDGLTWVSAQSMVCDCLRELSDGYVYAGATVGLFRSTDNGATWAKINSNAIYDIALGGNVYYAIDQTAVIYSGSAATDLSVVTDLGTTGRALIYYATNENFYASEDAAGAGQVYWLRSDQVVTVGRDETCDDEVVLHNGNNIAQISRVFVYDAAPVTWTAQFPVATFSYDLFPNVPAADDILYIGIESGLPNAGPFCNVTFDIEKAFTLISYTLVWEYWNGAWVGLTLNDETVDFSAEGVQVVTFVPPSDWATVGVNGVTGYWIRARLTAVAGAAANSAPTQQNRNLYTCNWSRVDVDSAQILGDIPALLRIRAHNRSDLDQYGTYGELDLMTSRLVVGLRSLDRGAGFVSSVNLADEQNPTGVVVSATGAASTFADKAEAPSSRMIVHDVSSTTSTGLADYIDAATVKLEPFLSSEFYGTFQAYLRAHLVENTGTPVVDADAGVQIRLDVRTGTGGINKTTKHRRFTGWDSNGENYKDWQLLRLGRIDLPASDILSGSEQPDQFELVVQVSASSALDLDVNLYDLWLLPVDEWAADLIDAKLINTSAAGTGDTIDVDSVGLSKRQIRATVRTADNADFVRATWQPITPGPAILQANASQRLWALTARAAYRGEQTGAGSGTSLQDSQADFIRAGVKPGMIAYNETTLASAKITAVAAQQLTTATIAGNWNNGNVYLVIANGVYKSEPWNAHSVQLTANQRYLSFRGNR